MTLVDRYASITGKTKKDAAKDVNEVIETLIGMIEENGQARVSGFGTFKLVTRAARHARNPQTGESILIPSRKTITFKVASDLKREL